MVPRVHMRCLCKGFYCDPSSVPDFGEHPIPIPVPTHHYFSPWHVVLLSQDVVFSVWGSGFCDNPSLLVNGCSLDNWGGVLSSSRLFCDLLSHFYGIMSLAFSVLYYRFLYDAKGTVKPPWAEKLG